MRKRNTKTSQAKWQTPRLTILTRQSPTEAVLDWCKDPMRTQDSGSGCILIEYGECLGNGTRLLSDS